jgi:putative redox protein
MISEGESLEGGVEVEATGRGKFQVAVRTPNLGFLADEPVAAGGLGEGPSPYELLSAALGACTAMTLRLYAARKTWPLQSVKVRVVHRRAALDARDRFAREIQLEGPLTPEQTRRLLEIADHCPVHRTLEAGADVVTVLAQAPLAAELAPGPGEHVRHMIEACDD